MSIEDREYLTGMVTALGEINDILCDVIKKVGTTPIAEELYLTALLKKIRQCY